MSPEVDILDTAQLANPTLRLRTVERLLSHKAENMSLLYAHQIRDWTARGKLRIVLASGSPRRKEILASVLLSPSNFACETSAFEETLDKAQFASAGEYALATARGKAKDVAATTTKPQSALVLVIGADTVIDLDGRIMEKPSTAAEAKAMLGELSGRTHKVHTGVVLLRNQVEVFAFVSTTEVEFARLAPDVIEAYVATGESFDKAGGYGIQGFGGACLVQAIRGDYFNVVGFPGFEFGKRLASVLRADLAA